VTRVEHYRRKVCSVPEEATVRQIAAILERNRVGCVVVVGRDGSATGIVTDRDLTLRVVASGRDPERTQAVAVMTQPVVTVATEDSLEQAIEQMARHGIRRVPVREGSTVVGMVSLDDLLSDLGRELEDLGELARLHGRKRPHTAGLPQVREEAEIRIQAFRALLERAGERTGDVLVREFDTLREGLRRILD